MICVDCRSMWAGPSGMLGYQRALARYLPAQAPGEHFQLLLRPGVEPDTQHPNAHNVYLPADPSSALAPLNLSRRLDSRGVALVHSTGGLWPKVDVPVVTTIHDPLWITEVDRVRPPGWIGSVVARVYRKLLMRAIAKSARIIVPSETARRAIEEIFPSVSDRIRVIPHGVGPEFWPLDPSDEAELSRVCATRHRLVPGAERFVLEVGRAVDHRNQLGLVRAFADAFRAEDKTHLAFVQPTTSRSRELMRLAEELGVERRTHIISNVSNEDLRRLYQGALCLCHPSSYESYPTPVAEAMASGCPVITSGRAATGETVGSAAQLVNPEHDDEIGAALRRVAYDRGLAARLRARGLDRAQRLRAEDSARATWDVYQETLASA